MSDNDKTRRIVGSSGGDPMKTRLIRRDQRTGDASKTPAAQAPAQPKTRVFFRPRAAETPDEVATAQSTDAERFVTGWLVVVHGPGRGNFATVYDGMNSIGRDEDQATNVDFGDESISRSNHAFITYDYKSRAFYLQHGGKANLVRLNDQPVLQPCELKSNDLISLGETIFRFCSFCSADFDWQD